MKKQTIDMHWLKKELKSYGLPPADREELAKKITSLTQNGRAAYTKNNWVLLLAPLKRRIIVMQAGMKRWSADPLRAKLYAKYLRLLLAARERIQNVKALNFGALSIPDAAKQETKRTPEAPVCADGLRWQDWIPAHTQEKVKQAFQTLYSETIPAQGHCPQNKNGKAIIGKQLVPFSDDVTQTTDAVRWGLLQAFIANELYRRQDDPNADPEFTRLMRVAQDVTYNRKDSASCKGTPTVDGWFKVLPPDELFIYYAWERAQDIRMRAPFDYPKVPDAMLDVLRDNRLGAAGIKKARHSEAQARWRAKKKKEGDRAKNYPDLTRDELIADNERRYGVRS
jgi:hypothetical protein